MNCIWDCKRKYNLKYYFWQNHLKCLFNITFMNFYFFCSSLSYLLQKFKFKLEIFLCLHLYSVWLSSTHPNFFCSISFVCLVFFSMLWVSLPEKEKKKSGTLSFWHLFRKFCVSSQFKAFFLPFAPLCHFIQYNNEWLFWSGLSGWFGCHFFSFSFNFKYHTPVSHSAI